ncbi:MAG: hypothetical protein VKO00_01870 [Cyanobacteriota bacterium]|jgi:hypothetical protein|nr:hypothetical protein [Cyanobacteriota bacterium]
MAPDSTGAVPTAGSDQTLKPDQALAVIGLGLLQKLAASGNDLPWMWSDADDAQADLAALRQRLELTRLAIDTGAPLTTVEVSHLLGARASGEVVERAGLRARRLSRNLWRLSRLGEAREAAAGAFGGNRFREAPQDGFGRRF